MTQSTILDQTIYLDRNGREIPIYIARLEKQARRPAVIIVHEIFGLNDHIKDVAKRLAQKGMVAFAPDLFASEPGLPEDRNDIAAMREIWSKIPDARIIEDLGAVYRQCTKHPDVMADKVGMVGFCMGGAMALMFAGSSHQISWVADFYGRIKYPELTEQKPKHPIDYVSQLRCPFIGIFGGKDDLITADQIEELTKALGPTKQKFEIKVYPEAGHAFFNDQREHFHAESAKDAWQKMLDFVAGSIRLPGAR
jgi:carboxymethylenebutenolidase